jgi:hypothetical protein
MGTAVRTPGAATASPAIPSPTAAPIPRRSHRLRRSGRTEKRAGRRRRASTKTAMVAVSTRNWVSATSGAPCSTKISAVP